MLAHESRDLSQAETKCLELKAEHFFSKINDVIHEATTDTNVENLSAYSTNICTVLMGNRESGCGIRHRGFIKGKSSVNS